MTDHSALGGIFDMTGVSRGPDGIKRYQGLPRNLVHMLRAAVERQGDAEAIVETGGGPRLGYEELWDRAARVAGGLPLDTLIGELLNDPAYKLRAGLAV